LLYYTSTGTTFEPVPVIPYRIPPTTGPVRIGTRTNSLASVAFVTDGGTLLVLNGLLPRSGTSSSSIVNPATSDINAGDLAPILDDVPMDGLMAIGRPERSAAVRKRSR
jgi:hypothetical protein